MGFIASNMNKKLNFSYFSITVHDKFSVHIRKKQNKTLLVAQKQLTYMNLVFGTVRKKIKLYFKTDAMIAIYCFVFLKCQSELNLVSSCSLSLSAYNCLIKTFLLLKFITSNLKDFLSD